ncbi:MAG TPA: CAP domain-containing protein [Bacteriovoracaceae bacterium]|nr:CAP domain-containing protein [Bacteriovoracaceae bacterium]
MRQYLFLIILTFCVSCSKNSSRPLASSDSGTFKDLTPATESKTMIEELYQIIDDHRADLGLRPFIRNDEVSELVQSHSDAMARGTVAFGHSGMSGRCSQAYSILGAGSACAENVAKGQASAAAAFRSWMNSPAHRGHLEDPELTHTGIAFAKSATGTHYWTQIFVNGN